MSVGLSQHCVKIDWNNVLKHILFSTISLLYIAVVIEQLRIEDLEEQIGTFLFFNFPPTYKYKWGGN